MDLRLNDMHTSGVRPEVSKGEHRRFMLRYLCMNGLRRLVIAGLLIRSH